MTISLINNPAEVKSLTVSKAWDEGTNIRKAMRVDPKQTKMYLAIELKKLIDFVDAKKTLRNDEELVFTIEAILEQCPTMKIEEIALVFKMIKQGKFGKLYERLKTAEILDIMMRYEGDIRSELLERRHREQTIEAGTSQRTSVANEIWNKERRKGGVNLSEQDLKDLGQLK